MLFRDFWIPKMIHNSVRFYPVACLYVPFIIRWMMGNIQSQSVVIMIATNLRPINIIHLTDLTLVEKCILPNEIFSSFKRLTQQIFKHIFEHLSWKLTWWAFLNTLSIVIFNFSKSTWPINISTTPSAMNGYRAYSNKGLYVLLHGYDKASYKILDPSEGHVHFDLGNQSDIYRFRLFVKRMHMFNTTQVI